ncbi:hypothetical protein QQC84_003691 [Escherichia coli]|nr:hypothetical protein [Escherichia coli]
MKLKPMGIPGQAPRHVKQWTKQEDALLISMYPKHSIREMTSRLNRSFHATGAAPYHLAQARADWAETPAAG